MAVRTADNSSMLQYQEEQSSVPTGFLSECGKQRDSGGFRQWK
ncbi:MAG: hypothetical protein ACE3JK_00510 [Sporolactobacillus sp.]